MYPTAKLRTLLVGAICLGLGIVASTIPSSAVTRIEKTFGSWIVTCVEAEGQDRRCTMRQSRIVAETKQMVFVWTLVVPASGEPRMTLAVPANVSIPEGINLAIGEGDPVTIGYSMCGPRVCVAARAFDAALLDAVKGSETAVANYVRANKRLVQVNLDLANFADAHAYLTTQAAQ